MASAGRVSKAEADLEARAKRMEQLHIRHLSAAERQRYADLWRVAQERFADSPAAAVTEADHLVTEVMRVRGYAMGDFVFGPPGARATTCATFRACSGRGPFNA